MSYIKKYLGIELSVKLDDGSAMGYNLVGRGYGTRTEMSKVLRDALRQFERDLDSTAAYSQADNYRKNLKRAQADLPVFEDQAKEPFKSEQELGEKLTRLAEVERILKERADEKAGNGKAAADEVEADDAPQTSRRQGRAAGTTLSAIRQVFAERFGNLSRSLDKMIARGEKGLRGGLVFGQSLDDVIRLFSEKTGRTLEQVEPALRFSRGDAERDSYRWELRDTSEDGLPGFATADFSLVPTTEINQGQEASIETGTLPDNVENGFTEHGLMGHAAHVVPGSRTIKFQIKDGHGQIGTLVADVVDGEVANIHDIALSDVGRGKGLGRKIIATLAANANGDILISEAIEQSIGFWDKMGAYEYDAYGNAKLNWQSHYRNRTGRQGGIAPKNRNGARGPEVSGQTGEGSISREEESWLNDFFNNVRYSKNGDIQGFFDPQSGLTFLVGDNLDADTAPGVVLHEVTHGSQREAVNQAAASILNNPQRLPQRARGVIARVRGRMQSAGAMDGKGNITDIDEAPAYLVEVVANHGRENGFSAIDGAFMDWVDRTFGQKIGNLMRDFVAMVRAGLRRLRVPVQLTVDDIMAMARYDMQRAADGRVRSQGDVVSGSRSEATRAAYERRIDELFAGAEPDNEGGVRVLDRSDVLDLMGLGDYEVLLAENHAVSDGRFNHPQFTADDWKSVPEWLDNPVAVFQRDDGRLTILAPTTKDGAPVIIGVNPGRQSTDGKMRYHLLLTAYDKDGGRMPIQKMLDSGQLRFIDLRKTPAFNRDSGHRLPSNHGEMRGLKGRIYTGKDLFKYRQDKPSFYMASSGEQSGDKPKFSRASTEPNHDPNDDSRLFDNINQARESILSSLKSTWDKSYGARLGALTLRQLGEVAADRVPQINGMVKSVQTMQTERNKMADAAAKLAERWQKLGKAESDKLAEMMHAATTAGVDPDKPYKAIIDVVQTQGRIEQVQSLMAGAPGTAGKQREAWNAEIKELKIKIGQEMNRKKAHKELMPQWDALPDEAKEIYREARDSYVEMSRRTEQAIIDRIEKAELAERYPAAGHIDQRHVTLPPICGIVSLQATQTEFNR
ncbi:MAG: hypothetical protein H7842_10570, partial [Gammaproteobacteria bacterium SHHR-1]